jgi:hypothetical protein
VNGPAFDPASHSFGETSWWSRRDFVKLSFAASGAIIAASLVGTRPKSYRVAALGADPYTDKVLDSIRRTQNTEIVSLSEKHARPDLIVIGAADLADSGMVGAATNARSSVLIVSHVCQPIAGLPEMTPTRLRKGHLIKAGGQKHLVPELISLTEMIQDRFCEANRRSIPRRTEAARPQVRAFSGWAVWIDPLA